MAHLLKRPAIHSGRLERFIGAAKLARVQSHMLNACGDGRRWYGPPIFLADVPGAVYVTPDGDFHGTFARGYFASALDEIEGRMKRLWREAGRQAREPMLAAGFASISDVLSRSTQGYRQYPSGIVAKNGPTGVANVSSTLWRLGTNPAAGAAGSAAPGGRACDNTTTGALAFTNPSSGTSHLVGAKFWSSVVNNELLLYDRLFDVAKTMNSTATEAVTGVPTRYQSTTVSNQDYIGGNFLFIEVGGTQLAATAHNWTVCLYTNQAGTAGQTMPSLAGNSGGIVDRLDHPTFSWAAPLAAGDSGIKALTQMQCSALVATGAVNFVIGHPIGMMLFYLAGPMLPFGWLTDVDLAPRIFDSACLAFLELNKPSTTATSYGGKISVVNAAP